MTPVLRRLPSLRMVSRMNVVLPEPGDERTFSTRRPGRGRSRGCVRPAVVSVQDGRAALPEVRRGSLVFRRVHGGGCGHVRMRMFMLVSVPGLMTVIVVI